MKRIHVLLAFCWLLASPSADAQPRRSLEDGATGALIFHSVGQSRAIILSATLTLPEARDGRLGAVVLAGDLPGPTAEATSFYVSQLLAAGVAVMAVDSFGARGLKEFGDAVGLAALRQVEDSYAALGLLSSHPAIDPARIALVGLGRGGVAAIEASLSALRDIARGDAPGASVGFAAIAALYPTCALQWRSVDSIGKPLLIQAGALDDLSGSAHCEDYARRLRAGNPAGVTLRIYPGLPGAWPAAPFERPEAERLDRCLALLDLDGSLTDRATGIRHQRGQISAFLDGCRLAGRRGGGGAPESAARAWEDLKDFLSDAGVAP